MLERRKKQLFTICEPVVLRLNGEKEWGAVEAIPPNVSEAGVLLISNAPVVARAAIELTIKLKQQNSPEIHLFGAGRVVRVETILAQNRFGIAVKCDAPLLEMSSSP